MKILSLHLSSRKLSRHDKRAITGRRAFPQTNYHYQATAEASAVASRVHRPFSANQVAEMQSLRHLSNSVAGAETRRQFAVEAALLGLVVAIVAWPLISLLIVLAQTARG